MTLSELVKLRLSIDELAHRELGRKDYQKFIQDSKQLEEDTANEQFASYLESARFMARTHLESLHNEMAMHFTQVLGNIDHYIKQEAQQYLNKDYSKFATPIDDDRYNRKLPLPTQTKDKLIGRLQLLSDWHYPGLEISPHDGEFTSHLVANDPLYIADVYQEYLDMTKSTFNELYQARLRAYRISLTDKPYLATLPKEQYGLVFCWNAFNYLPFDIVNQYLTEVFDLLRPGGTFLFSFNDAGMVNGAKHVEWGGMAYMTRDMIVIAASQLGYEVSYSHSEDTDWHNISWLEIKKPGQLTTIKAHQTLGIIKYISE